MFLFINCYLVICPKGLPSRPILLIFALDIYVFPSLGLFECTLATSYMDLVIVAKDHMIYKTFG